MSQRRTGRLRGWSCLWAALLFVCAAPFAHAQVVVSGDVPATNSFDASMMSSGVDSGLVQTGCSSCGQGGGTISSHGGDDFHGWGNCQTCGNNCIPFRKPCYPCEADSCLGKVACGLYECICCPDPCYDPHWIPIADAAFFCDAARPITQLKLYYDQGYRLQRPDRAEYFWPRQSTVPIQLGPTNVGAAQGVGRGPSYIAGNVNHFDLVFYSETAAKLISMIVEMRYKHLNPEIAPASLQLIPSLPALPASGYGDMMLGTKTLVFDCELIQISTLFKTFILTGNFFKGLGTGHMSLEPSIVLGIRIAPDCYMQNSFAYWIPLGGDPLYSGNIFHSHHSLNQILCAPLPNVQVIGTFEVNQWTIMGGAYTETDYTLLVGGTVPTPLAQSASTTIVSAGPGVRLNICDRCDIGVGTAFALTNDKWETALIRIESRLRF